jgi:hypothetical protein
MDGAQSIAAALQAQFRANVYAAPFDALAFSGLQINGNMEISQENGSTSVTLTGTGSLQTKFLVDGVMAAYRGTFVAAGQQVTDAPAGHRNSLKFTVSTAQSSIGANDELSVLIPVEGLRTAKMSHGAALAAPVALAFWVKAHRTGTYSGSLRNSAKNRSYPFNFTVSVADTWEYKTVVLTGDTSGSWAIDTAVGLYLNICIAGGTSRVGTAATWAGSDYSGATSTTNGVAATSDTFQITGVFMVPGLDLPSSDRLAYAMRPYPDELELSRRYFYNGVPPLVGIVQSSTLANRMCWPHLVPMRAAPTLTMTAAMTLVYGTGAVWSFATINSIANGSTVDVCGLDATVTGPLVAGNIAMIEKGSGNLNVDARL